jgi:osmotically inducible protein OsmC
MPTRNADAVWEGDLKTGNGRVKLGSGAFEGKYSFATRFEEAPGTNPEELIGAAHAGCFSMALSAGLGRAGFQPKRVHTTAKVFLEKVAEGFAITKIQLNCEANVPGIDQAKFKEQAEAAKKGCPVSKALTGVNIELDAKLLS